MSPWVFSIYIDGVVRKINAEMLDKGFSHVYVDGRKWNLNKQLCADQSILVADSEKLKQVSRRVEECV